MPKNNRLIAEYFPHYVGISKTKFILEHNWGNDGYAFWFKLLEILRISDGHYYDCSMAADMQYLTAYTGVDEKKALDILNFLSQREKIDMELWEKRKIIWCQSFVNNLEALYSTRGMEIPKRPECPKEQPRRNARKRRTKSQSTEEEPERGNAQSDEQPTEVPVNRGQKGGKQQPEKKKYGENVSLTDAEYRKLVEKYGEETTQKLIEKLDNAKGAKGYKYKSDFRAILSWVVNAVIGQDQKGVTSNGRTKRPEEFRSSEGFRPSEGFTPTE